MYAIYAYYFKSYTLVNISNFLEFALCEILSFSGSNFWQKSWRRNHSPYKAWNRIKGLWWCAQICKAHANVWRIISGNNVIPLHAVECAKRLISTHVRSPISSTRFPKHKLKVSLIYSLSLSLSLIIIPAACIMFVLARAPAAMALS